MGDWRTIMANEELGDYSKDQLIAELINRQTFVGVIVFHRGDAKAGRLEPGEIVMTKSPPLTPQGVENLLQAGCSLVPQMFEGPAETLPLHLDAPPLRMDQGGTVRIGNSRVTLDLVVEQYENGMTPEDMVRAYDTLVLADVHAAIAYYLRHGDEVRAYLKRRNEDAESLRAKIESDRPLSPVENCSRAEVPGRHVMLRLASDADVHGEIIRGLRRRLPGDRLSARPGRLARGNVRSRDPGLGRSGESDPDHQRPEHDGRVRLPARSRGRFGSRSRCHDQRSVDRLGHRRHPTHCGAHAGG